MGGLVVEAHPVHGRVRRRLLEQDRDGLLGSGKVAGEDDRPRGRLLESTQTGRQPRGR